MPPCSMQRWHSGWCIEWGLLGVTDPVKSWTVKIWSSLTTMMWTGLFHLWPGVWRIWRWNELVQSPLEYHQRRNWQIRHLLFNFKVLRPIFHFIHSFTSSSISWSVNCNVCTDAILPSAMPAAMICLDSLWNATGKLLEEVVLLQ